MRDFDILAEIREFREAYAEQFHYDIAAICRDLREHDLNSGRQYLTLPPKRIVPMVEVPLFNEPESESGTELASQKS